MLLWNCIGFEDQLQCTQISLRSAFWEASSNSDLTSSKQIIASSCLLDLPQRMLLLEP